MRKKLYAALTGIIIILGIIGIWYFINSGEEINLYEKGVFCFDGLSIGCSEEFFLRSKKDIKLTETRQGVNGEERIYAREFKSGALKRDVVAYYYFNDDGLQRGIYEIAFAAAEKEQVFDTAYDFFHNELTVANENIKFHLDFELQFPFRWENGIKNHESIYYTDLADNVYHMEYYILPEPEQKQHVLEVEIYRHNGWEHSMTTSNGWLGDIEICWDVEKDGNDLEKEDLNYLPQRLDIIRLAEDKLWVMNRETGELLCYKVAEDCSIWAMVENPASWGIISLELLAEAEKDNRRRDWRLGLNEQGEIEHLIECYIA